VLCPTRELALQIHESFDTYGRHTRVRQAVVFGGVNQGNQVRALRAGVDVLIATPGRLLDLMAQGLADISAIEILVLDEADRMLDMGFLPDLRRILTHVPRQRQTLLFSATMPAPIRKLANDILQDPVGVQVARVSSPAPSVEHWVYHVEKAEKPTLLIRVLAQTTHTRALVFTRTKHGADKVVKKLTQAGVRAAALHGNKSQNARTRALGEFRSAKTPILVATDIAARGLDVEGISHVINFDLTHEPETYVHRIGRTGRAGATGIALSFCCADEQKDLRAIERLLCAPLRQAGDAPRVAESRRESGRTQHPRATNARTRQDRPVGPPKCASRGRRSRRRRPSRSVAS
jgi:ATP-dependent RNA helicase RhlE